MVAVVCKILRYALVLWGLALAAHQAQAAQLPVLAGSQEAQRFVVIGDTHYTAPEFNSSRLVQAIAHDLRTVRPPVAFVCHTGDVVEGGSYSVVEGKRQFHRAGYEEMKHELAFAIHDLAEAFRVPVFIAVGNHDKHDPGHKAYDEVVLPVLSRQLGTSLSRTFYGFRQGNSWFAFLDFAPADYPQQCRFLEAALSEAAEARGIKHVFLFAHYPLWPVVRAGFDNPRFTDSLLPLLRQYPIDAYFCGHTHNTVVSVRTFQGTTITQIQGVVSQPGPRLVPIEDRRALLFPASESSYGWGYLEGSQTGYFLVTVEDQNVDVQFRIPGVGIIRRLAWQEPCKLREVTDSGGAGSREQQQGSVAAGRPAVSTAPGGPTISQKSAAPQPAAVTEQTLQRATGAALCFCPWADERTKITLLLNGEQIVQDQIGPAYSPFWDEARVAIPKEKLSLLRMVNEFRIGNPASAVFGIAHARLEVTLPDRTTVVTGVSQQIFFSCWEAEAKAAGKPRGWQIAPRHMIRAVKLGEPLGPIELGFPRPKQ